VRIVDSQLSYDS